MKTKIEAHDHLLSVQKMIENHMNGEYIIDVYNKYCKGSGHACCDNCYLSVKELCSIFKSFIIKNIEDDYRYKSIQALKYLIRLL